MSSGLSPDGLFKVSPIPCLCLVVGEKVSHLSPPEHSVDHVWIWWGCCWQFQLRWSVSGPVEGYWKLLGLGSCCCNECGWDVISNTCAATSCHILDLFINPLFSDALKSCKYVIKHPIWAIIIIQLNFRTPLGPQSHLTADISSDWVWNHLWEFGFAQSFWFGFGPNVLWANQWH